MGGFQYFQTHFYAAWIFNNQQPLFLLVCFVKWKFIHCILHPKLKAEFALM